MIADLNEYCKSLLIFDVCRKPELGDPQALISNSYASSFITPRVHSSAHLWEVSQDFMCM